MRNGNEVRKGICVSVIQGYKLPMKLGLAMQKTLGIIGLFVTISISTLNFGCIVRPVPQAPHAPLNPPNTPPTAPSMEGAPQGLAIQGTIDVGTEVRRQRMRTLRPRTHLAHPRGA